jgi:autotransporter-associated beta strand protein
MNRKEKMMKRQWVIIGMLVFILSATADVVLAQRQMEKLDRGVVAIKTGTNVLISWRIFGNEYLNVSYNLYRGSTKLNSSPITGPSYYVDSDNIYDSTYTVTAIINGVEQPPSSPVPVWEQNYIDIPLQRPAGGTNPSGSYTYSPNDASVGDLDGDGQYEIVLKWDPSNSKDNSQSGYTGNVYLDAYKLDGTFMWRIDLGINIRAGAHYTQFMVYDLDGDGKAELACKTAPGSKDASGDYLKLGPANGADHTADYRNSSGYILSGPEYFTIFDGETGYELATTDYIPPRGSVSAWGDSYGNRVDRFLACVAYLDGTRPSVVMCRGYYTRTVLAAWDWRDGQLTSRWIFDSSNGYPTYAGQGNHNLSVADVDDDGKDEIIYGAMAVDDDGTGLWTTGLGHGDAMHVSDIDPDRPGLEKWGIHEGNGPGSALLDARTGQILWLTANADVGRGVSADLTASFPGMECWGGTSGLRSSKNEYAGGTPSSSNHVIWWDSDDQRELLDGVSITKYNGGTQLTASLCSSNNGTKSNPCLQADILGDWHEEVIFRRSDNLALRMFVTKSGTFRKMYTLMHDPQYRLSIAWQNVAYNQPPHTSFYLADGIEAPPPPVSEGRLKWNTGATWDIQTSKNWTSNDTSAFYHNGDNVLFDMTGTNVNPIELKDTLKPSMVTVYSPTDYVFDGDGMLSGTMQLAKSGSGTLTINTNNDYEGETSVWDGELISNGTLSQSHVFVNRFSGIGGKGVFGKGISMPLGGKVTISSKGEADTLIIKDSLFVGGDAQIYFDLSDDTSGLLKTNDILRIDGDIMLLGKTTINVNLLDGKLGVGKYKLIDCTGEFTLNTDDINTEGLLGVLYEIMKTDSTLILESFYVRPPSTILWKGDQSDIWDQITSFNWLNNDTADWFVQNDTVIFDDTGSSTTTVQLASSLPVGEMQVQGSTDYTLVGDGFISGTGKLIKTGNAMLTLSTSNTYSGGTLVEDGLLMVTNTSGSATGMGLVTVKSGASLSGTGTVEGPVDIDEGGALSPGNKSIGTLTVKNDVTLKTGAYLAAEVNSLNNTCDKLAVTGQLVLDGILYITEVNAAPFKAGNSFKILDAPDCAGQFAEISPESPGENLKWDTTGLSSTGIIKVIYLTEVFEKDAEMSVRIFPNPVTDKLMIIFSGTSKDVEITINDLNGRPLFTSIEKSASLLNVDLSSIDPGVYIIKITSENQSYIRKILKH